MTEDKKDTEGTTKKVKDKFKIPEDAMVGMIDSDAEYFDEFDVMFMKFVCQSTQGEELEVDGRKGVAFTMPHDEFLEMRRYFYAGLAALAVEAMSDGPKAIAKALASIVTSSAREKEMLKAVKKKASKVQ